MSMKATVRQAGDVSIVDLAGRITLGEGSGLVRSTIKDLVNSGRKNILLNLKDVTYIDSAGLGVSIDMVDVSNQTSTAHRMLGTLLKTGDMTFTLYWEPASTQDNALFNIILTAPPPLEAWELVWPDGQ